MFLESSSSLHLSNHEFSLTAWTAKPFTPPPSRPRETFLLGHQRLLGESVLWALCASEHSQSLLPPGKEQSLGCYSVFLT